MSSPGRAPLGPGLRGREGQGAGATGPGRSGSSMPSRSPQREPAPGLARQERAAIMNRRGRAAFRRRGAGRGPSAALRWTMIARFSLYGFLKNLRFFEAFLVLALRERGLDYLEIGALVSVREVVTAVLEIPSGAMADRWGRRRCMVGSFVAYVVAYLVLGFARSWWLLAAGMAAYGVGQAFRSGTHKAMIHAWLRREGRVAERTEVYGYTRSWSKRGSALSALVGGALLAVGVDYRWVFVASALPALANVVNLASYPAALEGEPAAGGGAAPEGPRPGFLALMRRPRVGLLMLQTAGIEGGYTAVKDYVQPALAAAAIGLPVAGRLGEQQRVGLVTGVVSTGLFLVASAASRRAHRFEQREGGEAGAVAALAARFCALYVLLGAAAALGWSWAVVAAFVALAFAQNLWRPIHVGRFDDLGMERFGATVMSVESQLRTLAAAVLAPLVGALVDLGASGEGSGVAPLWPVAAIALAAALPSWWAARVGPRGEDGGVSATSVDSP